jgi:hypothetical protein
MQEAAPVLSNRPKHPADVKRAALQRKLIDPN